MPSEMSLNMPSTAFSSKVFGGGTVHAGMGNVIAEFFASLVSLVANLADSVNPRVVKPVLVVDDLDDDVRIVRSWLRRRQ